MLDVLEFGAVADGVTDNTGAIQTALNIAAEQGGVVYFPPGTFRITAPLLVGSRTWIRGAGRGVSRVVNEPSSRTNAFHNTRFEGDPNTHILISDLTIAAGAATGPSLHGVRFTNVRGGRIARCEITGFAGANILLQGNDRQPGVNQDIHIADCDIVGSRDSGIDVLDALRWSITGCTIRDNAQTGINLEPNADDEQIVQGRVAGNLVSSPSGALIRYGIHVHGYSFGRYDGVIRDLIVSENVVSAQCVGIKINGVRLAGIHVHGNAVSSCDEQGIFIDAGSAQTTRVVCTNNVVTDCSRSRVRGFSAIELRSARACVVANNAIFELASPGRHKQGVEESGSSENNVISGNQVLS